MMKRNRTNADARIKSASEQTFQDAVAIGKKKAYRIATKKLEDIRQRLNEVTNPDELGILKRGILDIFRDLKVTDDQVYQALKAQGNGLLETIANKLGEELQIVD